MSGHERSSVANAAWRFSVDCPGSLTSVLEMQFLRIASACVALSFVVGCASSGSSVDTGSSINDGLSGTLDQFSQMTGPCIDQAQRMTGLDRAAITVTDQIRTGGGPLLTLDAGGTKYSCRREEDGRVTVFSEYAN